METQKQELKLLCSKFMLTGISANIDQIITSAESQETGFMQFALDMLQAEGNHRQNKDEAKRLRAAALPRSTNLDHYDAEKNGLKTTRLAQLRELNWVDQLFNLVLMGPSGTGKTFLAAGLCRDAIKGGYKAYFRSMEDIVGTLKTKDFVKSEAMEYGKLLKANMIVIDDVMLFPLEKNLAMAFFNFINHIYENTSIIITTNKIPTEWAKMLDDEVLATALLDRLMFRSEIINLTGESHRLKNRETFFQS